MSLGAVKPVKYFPRITTSTNSLRASVYCNPIHEQHDKALNHDASRARV